MKMGGSLMLGGGCGATHYGRTVLGMRPGRLLERSEFMPVASGCQSTGGGKQA